MSFMGFMGMMAGGNSDAGSRRNHLSKAEILSHITSYRNELGELKRSSDATEGNTRRAFENLLASLIKKSGRRLVGEKTEKAHNEQLDAENATDATKSKNIRYDGVVVGASGLVKFGFWEAKDSKDDLKNEVKKKIKAGYKLDNTIFENTEHLYYYKGGNMVAENIDLTDTNTLADVLSEFVNYRPQDYKNYDDSLRSFINSVNDISYAIKAKLNEANESNKVFRSKVDDFLAFLQSNINESIEEADVYNVIAQHMLMGDIISGLFNGYNLKRNNIYKYVNELTEEAFGDSYASFNEDIGEFTAGIKQSLLGLKDEEQKGRLLIEIFEKFYKAYNELKADKNGIVYTPREVSDFIVASVDKLLEEHFTTNIYGEDVDIIDPCTGTGNFIKAIINYVPSQYLKDMYEGKTDASNKIIQYTGRLWAIEVDFMAYYIANLVIEGAYYAKTGIHKALPNMVLADTLTLTNKAILSTMDFMNDDNKKLASEVIDKKFTVIIGNPPYNASQNDESENNRNNIYEDLDIRIKETYQKLSNARKTQLQDPYVRFIRWASDKINAKNGGMVAFITNRSYVERFNMDGVRKTFEKEFDIIYVADLMGDVRANPKIAGTTHNIFGIQAGVAIAFLIKLPAKERVENSKCKIRYYGIPNDFLLRQERLDILSNAKHILKLPTQLVKPNDKAQWINQGDDDFSDFIQMFNKEGKKFEDNPQQIFKMNSRGVATSRDSWAYDFDKSRLRTKIQFFIEDYNEKRIEFNNLDKDEQKRLKDKKHYNELNNFTGTLVKWDQFLRDEMIRNKEVSFSEDKITKCMYRPFSNTYLYYEVDVRLINSVYQTSKIWGKNSQNSNISIVVMRNQQVPLGFLMVNILTDLCVLGRDTQLFPLYYYDEESGTRVDNITDWALEQFRTHYKNDKIEKIDIFYYIYAVLLRKEYIEKYKNNLFVEFPRIPYYENFTQFATLGKQLAELHTKYETLDRYSLTQTSYDSKTAKTYNYDKATNTVIINQDLVLTGLPKECLEFTLGTRTAIEWAVNMHRTATFAQDADLPVNTLQQYAQNNGTEYNEYECDNRELIELIERLCTLSIKHVALTTQLNQL